MREVNYDTLNERLNNNCLYESEYLIWFFKLVGLIE